MTRSPAQIVATISPTSASIETLRAMIEHQMDVVRLNFSWGSVEERIEHVRRIRELEKECGRHIPIIVDLPGPRVQGKGHHTYNPSALSALTPQDANDICFAVEHKVEYVAISFVGGPQDIEQCRKIIAGCGGTQKVIAKIERAAALDVLDEIIAASDAIMVARGDLGNEVPLERIPFVQDRIVKAAKAAGKPVIVATQMMLSMVENPAPTRAEVTDVANAILQGADAVMLSEETAKGKYPVEAVAMMERIVVEAERHMGERATINPL